MQSNKSPAPAPNTVQPYFSLSSLLLGRREKDPTWWFVVFPVRHRAEPQTAPSRWPTPWCYAALSSVLTALEDFPLPLEMTVKSTPKLSVARRR
jgi:hypothetical protein